MLKDFHPYFTYDGSVGLYSKNAQDVYHSVFGALAEAYEKFVLPAGVEQLLEDESAINVLDICFGIGYNSKSFLNYIFENVNKKSERKFGIFFKSEPHYNAAIHTDNIFNKKSCKKAVWENSKRKKIKIDAVDTDEKLFLLAPFFKTKNFVNRKEVLRIFEKDFKNEKIVRIIFKNDKIKNENFKIKKEINIALILKMLEKGIISSKNISKIEEIVKSSKLCKFFDHNLVNLLKFYENRGCNSSSFAAKCPFLHNIYYRYVSRRYNDGKKYINFTQKIDFDMDFYLQDARKMVLDKFKHNSYKYHLIFLDAFTPTKCPSLWSFDFFNLLYSLLDNNGRLLTYSKSAAVRSAMLEAGFIVGNTTQGTIAVKNEKLIKIPLTQDDLRLIKSKAGIFYRDENLNLNNDIMIKEREHAFCKSTRPLSSEKIKE